MKSNIKADAFISNVRTIWGKKGEAWLKHMPDILESLSERWMLSDIQPFSNLTYNFVARAKRSSHGPVVIKVACDSVSIKDEFKALQHFKGGGSVVALEYDEAEQALLLQACVPGVSLKALSEGSLEECYAPYTEVIKQLASIEVPCSGFKHVSEWCEVVDQMDPAKISVVLITKAKALRGHLLTSMKKEVLCHGDLHLDNVLQHGGAYLAIDPKGVVGEIAFEAAAFDFISDAELQAGSCSSKMLEGRIARLAQLLGVDHERLQAWVFLRCVISAQWFIEDGLSPAKPLLIAGLL